MANKFYLHVNATIIGTRKLTSKKGNEYLLVNVKNEFKNAMEFCDMNVANEELYIPNAKGDLLLAFTQGRDRNGNDYKNLSIEEFNVER